MAEVKSLRKEGREAQEEKLDLLERDKKVTSGRVEGKGGEKM